jgi:hypothetical protein
MLAPLRTCGRHGIALVQIAKTHHSEAHDFTLAVKSSIPNLERLAEEAEYRTSRLEQHLRGRLTNGPGDTWLDTLPWRGTAGICEMIGAVRIGGLDVHTADYSEDQWIVAGDAGFEIAREGESGLRTFWHDLQKTRVRRNRTEGGPYAAFGQMFRLLAHGSTDPAYDPVRELMRDHIIHTMPVGPDYEIFGRPVGNRVIHSVRSAHLEYGIDSKRLRRILIVSNLIPEHMYLAPDDATLFNADDAKDVLRKAASSINFKEVTARLRLPRRQSAGLIENGLLKPFVRPSEIPTTPFNFATEDVDAFLTSMAANAVDIEHLPEGVCDVLSAANRVRRSLAEILQLILDRKLNWIGRLINVSGLPALLVNIDEIKSHLHPEMNGYTRSDIQRILKISQRTIGTLVDNGYLHFTRTSHPVHGCRVSLFSKTEVTAFAATYISLVDLAAARNQKPSVVVAELEAALVEPALDAVGILRQFYRRSDLLKIST